MRLTAAKILLAFALAGTACATGPPIERQARRTPSPSPQTDGTTPAPDCGTIGLGRDEYGTTLDGSRGSAGTEVTLSGTTLRGEDGRWAPSDRLEAWWNTEVPRSEQSNAQPLRSGPVVKLVEVDDMERCHFEATFTVPNVEPGRYKISVFVWDANPENGYGFFLPHRFTVTEG